MNRFAFTLLLLLTCVFQAVAASVPEYNTIEGCKQMTVYAGGNDELEKSCLRTEGEIKDRIAGMDVPDKLMTICDQIVSSGGTGSYALLERCLHEERSVVNKLDE